MKYALYILSNLQVVQWQDDAVATYPLPAPWEGRLALTGALPPEFDPYGTPSGYWVVDDELTSIAPPPPLSEIAMYARWAVTGRRVSLIAEGVDLAGGRRFRPTDADLARVAPIAKDYIELGIASIDIQLDQPPVWYSIDGADLAAAYAAFLVKRELCYSNERAHLEAIAAMLVAEDRPGLTSYDSTTGWPS